MSTEPRVTITFRHMESSDLVRNFAMEQLEKVISFLAHEESPVLIELILEPSKTHAHHKIELIVSSPHYHKIISYERPGIEFYELIGRVIDIMYRELHEAKRQRINKLREKVSLRHIDSLEEEPNE